MCTAKHDATHIDSDFFKNSPALTSSNSCLLCLLHSSVQARCMTALASVSFSLGPSLVINMRLSTWTSIKCDRHFVFPWFYILKLHSLGTLLAGMTEVMAEVLRYWQFITMTEKEQVRTFCVVFFDMMPSCRMCLVPHANKLQETGNSAGSWHRQYHNSRRGSKQWTIIDLVQFRSAWLGNCPSWSVFCNWPHTPMSEKHKERERQRERESEPSLKSKCILPYQSWIICI